MDAAGRNKNAATAMVSKPTTMDFRSAERWIRLTFAVLRPARHREALPARSHMAGIACSTRLARAFPETPSKKLSLARSARIWLRSELQTEPEATPRRPAHTAPSYSYSLEISAAKKDAF